MGSIPPSPGVDPDRVSIPPSPMGHQVLGCRSRWGFDPTESDGGFDPIESSGFDPTKSWGVDPDGLGFRTRLMGFDP